jgi:RNA polymerase II transcription elongation factor
MAVQHSPALPPMRPGLIDPSRQAEYSIHLGKSLSANRSVAAKQMLNVRYNWKSKQIPQRQVITENRASSDSYRLVVREGTSEPYKYSGTVDPKTTDPDSTYLALVYDKEKSAFTLESISSSLNFNLTSATTKPNIEQLHQLETLENITENASQPQDNDELGDSDEDAADTENPYDYRNFLSEATKDAEAENATPKPSIIAMPSPKPGASKILTANKSATPLQSPFMGPSKRRKVESKITSRGVPKTGQPGASSAQKAKSRTNVVALKGKPGYKSAEKIMLSDEEDKKAQATRSKQARSRDALKSQTQAASPQIIVDEASDLTIYLGSPPQKARQKHRINPNAFAGHSGAQSRANTASVSPQGRNAGKESEGDAEADVEMDDDDGDNSDIEDLALPSPRETRTASSTTNKTTIDRAVEDDDEDDGLAAELEAVFDQEDDGDSGTVGLGISGGHRQETVQNDDESEVSEEE